MAVKKISVALDLEIAEAAAEAAAAQGRSLSSWLNDAARGRLVLERGRRAVVEWQSEHGVLTDQERASAEAVLDQLFDTPRHRSA